MTGLWCLTLRQPYASLVAPGPKWIETRDWQPRQVRPPFRIGIHAGSKRPKSMHLPPLSRHPGDPANRQTWYVCDTITDPDFTGPRPQGSRVPLRATTPTMFYPHEGPHGRPWDETAGTNAIEQGTAILLPLGALVATATVVDICPIGGPTSFRTGTFEGDKGDFPGQAVLVHHPDLGHGESLVIDSPDAGTRDVSDQLPFGDFTPGRVGWLLYDRKPTTERCPACWGSGVLYDLGTGLRVVCVCGDAGRCDPIPMPGQRGLWKWTP